MRWRVVPGGQVMRRGSTLGPGEEFDATADEAKQWDGLVVRVDTPKPKPKD